MSLKRAIVLVMLLVSISSLLIVVLVAVVARQGTRDGGGEEALSTGADKTGESSTWSNLDVQNEENSSDVIRRDFIENIFRSPHAKLFTEADKTGNVLVYDFKASTVKGGCYNLKKYAGKIKSVDTLGTCLRLFSSYYCTEWSQAMYPGSTYITDAKLNGVLSVGPCVSNEFDHSTVVSSVQLEKLRSALESFANVPDLIHDARTLPNYTKVEMRSSPVEEYLLGPGNRVEALRGYIYSRHVKSPESAENARVAGLEQSFYSKLALEEGDEPGFAFPLELGGPADQFYNVFPQNRKQAGDFKEKIVPLVKQLLKDNPSHLWWSVSFIYQNSTTTRPSGMWYRASRNDEKIFYGYVPNSD